MFNDSVIMTLSKTTRHNPYGSRVLVLAVIVDVCLQCSETEKAEVSSALNRSLEELGCELSSYHATKIFPSWIPEVTELHCNFVVFGGNAYLSVQPQGYHRGQELLLL